MGDLDELTQSEESYPPDNEQHSLSAEELEKFYEMWWSKGVSLCISRGVDPDEAEDIVTTILGELIEKQEFVYKDEFSTMGYLAKNIRWRILDYHRKEARKKVKQIPWQREGADGQIIELEDYVSDEDTRDSMDLEQRTYVVEIAELCRKDCQINEKQLELVKWRMLGEPLSEEWTQSSIDTNWSRIKIIIRLRALKENDA